MAVAIKSVADRKKLTPRREPYWDRVEAGAFLGYRKLEDGTGTWIARWRCSEGKQNYRALGSFATFDEAIKEARAWFDHCKGGSPKVFSVEEACKRYVEDRRLHKGEATAKDAAGRFNRSVYNSKFGRINLPDVRTADLIDWRNRLINVDENEDDPDAERRAKDSANRNLATLKAALNHAYRMGLVSVTAQWDRVEAYKGVGKRRDASLTISERRKLFAAASPDLKKLVRALLVTAARPGEIVTAKVGDLNLAGLLTLDGKTGRRTIPISPDALKHLTECAGDRRDDELLIIRADGRAWNRHDWRDALREARTAAGLPDTVVLYSLRHIAISEMLVSGIDPMTVAKIAGTSVEMISRHYGHLIKGRIVSQLAKVKVL